MMLDKVLQINIYRTQYMHKIKKPLTWECQWLQFFIQNGILEL